jgi:PAS domain S-box-containing protein
MHDCASAHGTRLKGDVQSTVRKSIISHPLGGVAQGHHFGMGGRIMAQDGLIEASADDNAVSRNDESANGYFAAASGLMREGNGSPHEKDVLIRTRKRHGDLQLIVSQVLLGILKQHRGKTRQNENGPASGRALPMSAMPNSAPEQEKDALSPPRLSPALRAAAAYLLAALTCVIGTMFFTDRDGGNALPPVGPVADPVRGGVDPVRICCPETGHGDGGTKCTGYRQRRLSDLVSTPTRPPQWLYAVDSSEVLALNAAAAKLYGLTADSVTAVSAEALIRPLPQSPQSSTRLTHQTVGGRARELETHVSGHSFSGRHCHLVTVRDTACEHLSESLFAEALAKVQPVLYRFDPVRECYDYISDRGADWLDTPIHALCSPGGWQQFARRVDTKDLDRIRVSVGDALKTPGDEPVEISVAYQLKSRTGPRWISDAMTLLRHPDGSLRAIVGAASDQTEEQCAASKRTDQEAGYRALVENAPVGIFHFTAELLVSYCNSRLADILKSSPEQLAGMDLHSLGDEAILSVLHGALQGQRGAYDGPFVSPLSTDMQILSIRVAPEFDAAGKVFGGVGIIEDRTAFLEAEEQLRDTRERYVLAQRGTNEGLWDWDPKTRHLYLSARLLSLLGLHSDTLRTTGDEWLKLIHPDDRQRYRTDFVAHLRGETEHFESEYRIADKDGKFHWVSGPRSCPSQSAGPGRAHRGAPSETSPHASWRKSKLKSERDFSRGPHRQPSGTVLPLRPRTGACYCGTASSAN